MNTDQVLVLVAAVAAVWAAFFATRADFTLRRALKRMDTASRPVPSIVFTGNVSPGQAVDLEVENLLTVFA